jgi:hypothetical protein
MGPRRTKKAFGTHGWGRPNVRRATKHIEGLFEGARLEML